MRQHSAPKVQLKAACGVRNIDQLFKVCELGCTPAGPLPPKSCSKKPKNAVTNKQRPAVRAA